MGFDAKIVTEQPAGGVRVGTLVCALITVICYMVTSATLDPSSMSYLPIHCLSAWVVMVIGIILLILGLFGLLENEILQAVDKVFHALAAGLLLVTSLIVLVQYLHATSSGSAGYALIVTSGFFGLFTAILATVMAYLLFTGGS